MSLKETLIAEARARRAKQIEEQIKFERREAAKTYLELRKLIAGEMLEIFPGESYTIHEPEDLTDPHLYVSIGDLYLKASIMNCPGLAPCVDFQIAAPPCPFCGQQRWFSMSCSSREEFGMALECGKLQEHVCPTPDDP